MSWRGTKGGIEAAKAGHDVVMAPNSHTYFDHYQSKDTKSEPIAIGGFLPLEKVYSYNPIPTELTEEEAKHALITAAGPDARRLPLQSLYDRTGSWKPAIAIQIDEILAAGVERARSKLEYTPLATSFCPPEFTVAELRRVYEAVWATRLDPRTKPST